MNIRTPILPTVDALIKTIGLKDYDCHGNLPRDNEYHGLGLGGGAISLEEGLLLAGLLAVTKPDVVIELGTSKGASTLFLASVLKDLNKGKLYSVDFAKNPPIVAFDIAKSLGLTNINWCLGVDSLTYLNSMEIDPNLKYMVFSDTDIKVRPDEVKLVYKLFPSGTFVAVHDTSDLHPFGPMNLESKLGMPVLQFPSPRGLSLLEVRK